MILFGHAGLHSWAEFSFPGPCGKRCLGDEFLGLEFKVRVWVELEYHLYPHVNSYHEIKQTSQEELGKISGSKNPAMERDTEPGLGLESQDQLSLILYA